LKEDSAYAVDGCSLVLLLQLPVGGQLLPHVSDGVMALLEAREARVDVLHNVKLNPETNACSEKKLIIRCQGQKGTKATRHQWKKGINIPAMVKNTFPGRMQDAMKAMKIAKNSFQVACGCFHISRLQLMPIIHLEITIRGATTNFFNFSKVSAMCPSLFYETNHLSD
jgi:hypothetical protein